MIERLVRLAQRGLLATEYAPQIEKWLRQEPDVASPEILRRVRLAGYRGGKSALYELVRRLRRDLANLNSTHPGGER
jgi:hypothetical protein